MSSDPDDLAFTQKPIKAEYTPAQRPLLVTAPVAIVTTGGEEVSQVVSFRRVTDEEPRASSTCVAEASDIGMIIEASNHGWMANAVAQQAWR